MLAPEASNLNKPTMLATLRPQPTVSTMADPEATSTEPATTESPKNDFASQADEEQVGLVREFIEFLGENKKWWLLPIIIVLLLFGALFLVAPSVAPFIYTLF